VRPGRDLDDALDVALDLLDAALDQPIQPVNHDAPLLARGMDPLQGIRVTRRIAAVAGWLFQSWLFQSWLFQSWLFQSKSIHGLAPLNRGRNFFKTERWHGE